MIWARKKTGVPIIRINSVVEADEILKKYSIFVVGLFKKFEVRGMLAIALLYFSKAHYPNFWLVVKFCTLISC